MIAARKLLTSRTILWDGRKSTTLARFSQFISNHVIMDSIDATFFDYAQSASPQPSATDDNADSRQFTELILSKSPYTWTCGEVADWIVSLQYTSQAKKFKAAKVDGARLFTLNRASLQNEVKIFKRMPSLCIHSHIYTYTMHHAQQVFGTAF